MEELGWKLQELRIAHDVEHIDLLISKLEASSYVTIATRSRVVDLLRSEVPTPELVNLREVFSRSAANYIPRATVRRVIEVLRSIKEKAVPESTNKTDWTEKEWFCRLVDSEAIVPFLREIFNALDVCRCNIISPLFTIVLYGKKTEVEFFEEFMKLCSAENELIGMSETIAKKIFKYYGGVVIIGSADCVHIMAGNNKKSVANCINDGTRRVL